MRILWFISNERSGSASAQMCEAIEAVFSQKALSVAGRTRFPAESLPDPQQLDDADVDTVVLFAGDGTINAAASALANWQGGLLILPGGTMNLLARKLHDSLDPEAILHAAHQSGRRIALSYVEAANERALAGAILGPAAYWYRARENARSHRLRRVFAAVRHAWRATMRRGLRIDGVPALSGAYQAVLVEPRVGTLHVAGVVVHDWRTAAGLGIDWLRGQWLEASAVDRAETSALRAHGGRPMLALFDGEPVMLPPGAELSGGTTRPQFLSTREEEGA